MRILFVIHTQYDYIDGTLAIPDAKSIIPVINKAIISYKYDAYIFSREWHSINHTSFASYYNVKPFTKIKGVMKWPDHCIQNTHGAQIHHDIVMPVDRVMDVDFIHTGDDPDCEHHSAIDNMYPDHIDGAIIDIMGLSTDHYVKCTAIDLVNRTKATEVNVLLEGCRGAEFVKGDTARAIKEMTRYGVNVQ